MKKQLYQTIFFFLCFTIIGISSASAATLSLSPTNPSVLVNGENTLSVIVNTTGDNAIAVDAVITYDATRVTIVSITTGSIFASYPLQTASNGEIRISGIDNTFSSPFNGTGTLATIRYRGIIAGATNFTLQYTSGSTVDSNVVQQNTGVDLLTGVTNATLTVGSSSLPSTGTKEDTIMLGIYSIILGLLISLYIAKKQVIAVKYNQLLKNRYEKNFN